MEVTGKAYLVRFKPRGLVIHTVPAAGAEIYGEHLILLDSTGKVAALFLLEIVESWSELS
jgi:hypothetical protein